MACPSPAQCWAVGQSANAPGGDVAAERSWPLLEHEAGGRWQTADTPLLRGAHDQLEAIACPAARDCWAVGGTTYTGRAVIEHWTGGAWRLAPSPAVRYGELTSIACVSASDCWAVGATQTLQGAAGQVVEHWDGVRWRTLPAPPGGQGPPTVACPAAGDCWVAGFGKGGADRLLHGRWIPALLPVYRYANATNPGFTSVACASESECWAVGDTVGLQPSGGTAGNGPPPAQPFPIPGHLSRAVNLLDHWDGRAWRPADGLLPARAVATAASCAGGSCWLLGYAGPAATRALVLRWSAGRWVAQSLPGLARAADLNALACSGACWVVGYPPGRESAPVAARVAG